MFSLESPYVVCAACCVFSLELPHQGDINEYTQHTIINVIKKITKITPNTIKSAAVGFFVREIRTSSK